MEFAIGEEDEEVDDDEDTETEDNLNGGDGAGDARPFRVKPSCTSHISQDTDSGKQ